MKQLYLLIKVMPGNNYSPSDKINEYSKMRTILSGWGSNHNLRTDTINKIISDNINHGFKKTYILFLFSKGKKEFNYVAELKEASKVKIQKYIPKLFYPNKHRLWIYFFSKSLKCVSGDSNYELRKYKTINNKKITEINNCSMARIHKIR